MKGFLKKMAICTALTVMMLSPGNFFTGYNTRAYASEEKAISYEALDFGSGYQTSIKFSVKKDSVRRFELLYETPGYDNAVPVANIDMNGKVYSATYGHVQEEGSPVTVRKGRDIASDDTSEVTSDDTSDDTSKGKLKTIVIYVDTSKNAYSGEAELSISKTGISTLVFAATSVPKGWKNIADGEEDHMYPATNTFQYYTDPATSFYTADDLAKIESEGGNGTSGDELSTVSAPVKEPVDNTGDYLTLITVGGAIAAVFIIYAIFAGKKKAKKKAAIKAKERKAKRAREVEKIKDSEDISEVLDELDYSDDDVEPEDDDVESEDDDVKPEQDSPLARDKEIETEKPVCDDTFADNEPEAAYEPKESYKATDASEPVMPAEAKQHEKDNISPKVFETEKASKPVNVFETEKTSKPVNAVPPVNVTETIEHKEEQKKRPKRHTFATPVFLTDETNA